MLKMSMALGLSWLIVLAGRGIADAKSVAELANPLENIGGSARAMSMGSAFVAVAADSSALLWNPAGLSGLQEFQVGLHHTSWLAGIIRESVVTAFPVNGMGSIGLSASYVGYGTLNGYDDTGAQGADVSANRLGFGVGWGKEVFEGLAAGIAVRGSSQTIGGVDTSSFSGDLGTRWAVTPSLELGLVYANAGTKVSGASLASALRLGGAYRMEVARSHRLLLAAGGAWEPGGVSRLQVGAEDVYASALALRLGYQADLADTRITGARGLTAGAGFMLKGFTLDYAITPFGDLGTSHWISLGYHLGGTRS